jgi:hypothetical protein
MPQNPMIHSPAVRLLALLTIGAVATTVAAQSDRPDSPADPDAPEVTACLQAVEQDVSTQRPSADDLVFAVGSIRAWQESKKETGIRGQGWYLGGRGNWKDVAYTCIYDTQASEITSSQVDFQDPVEDVESPPKYRADPDAPASRACLQAIESRIQADRPRLQELDFDHDSLAGWQESEGEIGVSGAGEYVGGAGNRKSFIFSCVYDEQKQKATTARYRVKS